METLAYTRPKPVILPSQTSFLSSNSPYQLGIFTLKYRRNHQSPILLQLEKPNRDYDDDDGDNDGDDGEDRGEAGVIPETVTNRMMSRMAFSVGIPLFTGLFFPLFYYLKAGLKIDVPTWIAFIVSIFFGTALLVVSYGIVSSGWDPMREGSFWGWTEAQKNWPVFWQSIWGWSWRIKEVTNV